MDKLGNLITSLGTLLRDVFLYLVPAIPFILFAVPLLEDIGVVDMASLTSKVKFLNRPILAETTIIVVVYVVGRILNALSYPLFGFYRATIGKLPFKQIKDFWESANAMKDVDEHLVFAKVLKSDKEVYSYLIERNILVSMSEQSFSTTSFCIGLVIVLAKLFGSTLIPWGYALFYAAVAFFLSLLFVFMHVSTMTEYYGAIKSLSKLNT